MARTKFASRALLFSDSSASFIADIPPLFFVRRRDQGGSRIDPASRTTRVRQDKTRQGGGGRGAGGLPIDRTERHPEQIRGRVGSVDSWTVPRG